MSIPTVSKRDAETGITVCYWAGARSAVGVDQDFFEVAGPVTLEELVGRVLAKHPETHVGRTIGVCSVLLGDRPVSSEAAADVVVTPGDTVQFLPPFAGG